MIVDLSVCANDDGNSDPRKKALDIPASTLSGRVTPTVGR
jgi:hypothetical protein